MDSVTGDGQRPYCLIFNVRSVKGRYIELRGFLTGTSKVKDIFFSVLTNGIEFFILLIIEKIGKGKKMNVIMRYFFICFQPIEFLAGVQCLVFVFFQFVCLFVFEGTKSIN